MTIESILLTKFIASDFSIYYPLVKEDNVMQYITSKGLTFEEARKKIDSINEINAKEKFKMLVHY